MPIRHYLQGHRFAPETARLLGVVRKLESATRKSATRSVPIKIAVIVTAKKPRTCMVIYLFNLLGGVDLIDLQLGLIEFAGTAATNSP